MKHRTRKLLGKLGCAGLTVVLLAIGVVLAAVLSEDSAPVSEMTIDVELQGDGTADVTLALTMDFSQVEGRGPILSLPTAQKTDVPGEYVVYPVTVHEVTSPSGASTSLKIEEFTNATSVRIGQEDITYDTPQEYVISYTVGGLITPNPTGPDGQPTGMDEFSWNAIGTFESEIKNLTVNVTAPAAPEETACFHNDGLNDPCEHSVSGSTATYTVPVLAERQPVQVVAVYPQSVFGSPPRTTDQRVDMAYAFQTHGARLLSAAAALALAVVMPIAYRRWRRRQELTRGLPRGAGAANVPVQFHPPRGVPAADVSLLREGRPEIEMLSVAIVDLAARGHLVIDPLESKFDGYAIRTAQSEDPLLPHEVEFLKRLMQGDDRIFTTQFKATRYKDFQKLTERDLIGHALHAGWFRQDPKKAVRNRKILGWVLFGLTCLVSLVLAVSTWGWLALVLPLLPLGMVLTAGHAPKRTPAGSALLREAYGFERYISTAEAHQIRFERSYDVFSRYLPYAMAFGVADRWTEMFEHLERQGVYHADTSFANGAGLASAGGMDFSTFTSAFTSSMSSSVSASTSSNGGSGTSGGGGSSGGGVSGGSW